MIIKKNWVEYYYILSVPFDGQIQDKEDEQSE